MRKAANRGAGFGVRLGPWLAVSAFFLAAASAQAQFPGDVPDTFRLRLGGMYAWFNTDVNLEETVTPAGLNVGISSEDLLGVPSSAPGFSARGYWNVAGRFFVDFGWTGFSRSETDTIAQDFDFGGVTYTLGSSVETSIKSSLPYVDIRYGIVNTDSTQFGVSIGAAYPNLKAKLSASAGILGPGGPIIGQTVSRTAQVDMVVPLLGLQFDTRLGEGLSAGILVNGIFAPVSPYSGSIFDAEAHVDWFFTPHFGVSGAFNYTRYDVKREDEVSLVEFEYSYYGPRAYLILTF